MQCLKTSIFLLILASTCATPISAAEFCVTNGIELDNALADAATNGEDDTIKLHTGTYQADLFSFEYNAANVTGGDDNDLTIIGGYSDFFMNPCGQRVLDDPLLTVLDGNGSSRVLKIDTRAHGNVTVRLLAFIDGNASGSYGGGLYINALDGASGTITVERNVFDSNLARYGGGLSVASRSGGFGLVRVVNNLFIHNHAESDGNIAAANLANLDDHGFADARAIYFVNNTVLANVAETSQTYATAVQLYGKVNRYVFNNNLWNNVGADLQVYAPSGDSHAYHLLHNNFANLLGATPTSSSGNISVTPVYQENGGYAFTPARNSPLVDAGISPPPISPYWYLTSLDLALEDRVVGPAVDIGAYENERIFQNGFDQGMPL